MAVKKADSRATVAGAMHQHQRWAFPSRQVVGAQAGYVEIAIFGFSTHSDRHSRVERRCTRCARWTREHGKPRPYGTRIATRVAPMTNQPRYR
jgi:hypothetical protein